MVLIEELERAGCSVEFLDRPMSHDPHDQLLLQIRGAVAEYERVLIAERIRRGRQLRLRPGTLLPGQPHPTGIDPRPTVRGIRPEFESNRSRECWYRNCSFVTWSRRAACLAWRSICWA